MYLLFSASNLLPSSQCGFKTIIIQSCSSRGLTVPVDVAFFLLQAPWPVNIVIDSSCQKLYNLVFLFLLKLKQAKWSLDELRLSGVFLL